MTQSCKFSGYRNCSSNKSGTDFCLFHKPNKNKEERIQFYRELLDQIDVREEPASSYDVFGISEHTRLVFESSLDFSGYYFPKIPQKKAHSSLGLEIVYFEKQFHFEMLDSIIRCSLKQLSKVMLISLDLLSV